MGRSATVRFEDHEWEGVLEPLRDPERFAQVFVDEQLGTIVWPGGLDMAPEPLYSEARQTPVAPAAPRT